MRRMVRAQEKGVAHEHQIALGGLHRVGDVALGLGLFHHSDRYIGAGHAIGFDFHAGIFALEGFDHGLVRFTRERSVAGNFAFGFRASVENPLAVLTVISNQLGNRHRFTPSNGLPCDLKKHHGYAAVDDNLRPGYHARINPVNGFQLIDRRWEPESHKFPRITPRLPKIPVDINLRLRYGSAVFGCSGLSRLHTNIFIGGHRYENQMVIFGGFSSRCFGFIADSSGTTGGVQVLLIDHPHVDHLGDVFHTNWGGTASTAFAVPLEGNAPES